MPPRLLVRALPLNQSWLPIGTDVRRGIWVEDFECSSDTFGPADATFTLRRKPTVAWPDLQFWTPMRAELENQRVWAGRYNGTPAQDDGSTAIGVQAQGSQFVMDDVPFDQMYVRNSLGDWTDIRSNVNASLGVNQTAVTVSNDQTGITLTQGNAVVRAASTGNGVYLDLGPNDTATRIVISWSHSNNSSQTQLVLNAGSFAQVTSMYSGGATFATLNAAPTGTFSATFSPVRYIGIFLCDNAGAPYTAPADVWAKITSIQVFSSTAYESGGASILEASDVATDIFANHLPTITKSVISTTAFPLPTFNLSQQTPRDGMTQANSFQNWQFRIREDNVFEFRPLPSSPVVALTDQAAFQDLSGGSGDTIYNQVTYVGTGPDGTPVVVTRTTTLAGLPVTIPDRRGQTKAFTIQSSATLTAAAASQLCDVFLEQRNRTPFKGTISATSRKAVAIMPSGAACPAYHLLRLVGELVSFRHLQDPDTAALGRTGRIAKVTYTHATDSAQVDIDSTPGSFEAMSARLAVATAR